MTGDCAAELIDLQYHWGSAYMVSHPEPVVWLAQRRDDYQTLRSDGPAELLRLIHADYFARPVPRYLPGRY
jgi:hypothetical protein